MNPLAVSQIAKHHPLEVKFVRNAVIEILASLPKDLPQDAGRLEWTQTIIKRFRKLGHELNCEVCPDEDSAAWLYDLVWYRNDQDHRLVEVSLVLESEWNLHWPDIRYDFEKLLLAKSRFKVMIYEETGEGINKTMDRLHESIETFGQQVASETYMLAAFRHKPRSFVISIIGSDLCETIETNQL